MLARDFLDREMMMVELVMEDDRETYRVILVSWERNGGAISAHCYKLEIGGWSIMDSDLVYGRKRDSYPEFDYGSICVFDCTMRTLVELMYCASMIEFDYRVFTGKS
jgi:hypothetical protein